MTAPVPTPTPPPADQTSTTNSAAPVVAIPPELMAWMQSQLNAQGAALLAAMEAKLTAHGNDVLAAVEQRLAGVHVDNRTQQVAVLGIVATVLAGALMVLVTALTGNPTAKSYVAEAAGAIGALVLWVSRSGLIRTVV